MDRTLAEPLPRRRLGRAAGLLTPVLLVLLGGCVVAPPRGHVASAPRSAPPQAMYFYPEQGQSPSRQDRDRYECYRWAVQESGTDPGMSPVNRRADADDGRRGRSEAPDGSGVLAGAAAGAAIGAITSGPRHAAESAVMGALFGATLGAIAENGAGRSGGWRDERAAAPRGMDDFRRAMGACMAGRGYRLG